MTVEEIKKLPQTYETILGVSGVNNTLKRILKRKLNCLHRSGVVSKTIIPKSRFGKVIYYTQDKKYQIIFENTRTGINTYCFVKYKRNKSTLDLLDCYYLDKTRWEKIGAKTIIIDKIIKWV